jgi:hypothetical protein
VVTKFRKNKVDDAFVVRLTDATYKDRRLARATAEAVRADRCSADGKATALRPHPGGKFLGRRSAF